MAADAVGGDGSCPTCGRRGDGATNREHPGTPRNTPEHPGATPPGKAAPPARKHPGIVEEGAGVPGALAVDAVGGVVGWGESPVCPSRVSGRRVTVQLFSNMSEEVGGVAISVPDAQSSSDSEDSGGSDAEHSGNAGTERESAAAPGQNAENTELDAESEKGTHLDPEKKHGRNGSVSDMVSKYEQEHSLETAKPLQPSKSHKERRRSINAIKRLASESDVMQHVRNHTDINHLEELAGFVGAHASADDFRELKNVSGSMFRVDPLLLKIIGTQSNGYFVGREIGSDTLCPVSDIGKLKSHKEKLYFALVNVNGSCKYGTANIVVFPPEDQKNPIGILYRAPDGSLKIDDKLSLGVSKHTPVLKPSQYIFQTTQNTENGDVAEIHQTWEDNKVASGAPISISFHDRGKKQTHVIHVHRKVGKKGFWNQLKLLPEKPGKKEAKTRVKCLIPIDPKLRENQETQIDNLASAIIDLEHMVRATKAEKQEVEQEVASLARSLETAQAVVEEKSGRIEELVAEMDGLHRRCAEKDETLTAMKAGLGEREKDIHLLKEQRRLLKEEVRRLRVEARKIHDEHIQTVETNNRLRADHIKQVEALEFQLHEVKDVLAAKVRELQKREKEGKVQQAEGESRTRDGDGGGEDVGTSDGGSGSTATASGKSDKSNAGTTPGSISPETDPSAPADEPASSNVPPPVGGEKSSEITDIESESEKLLQAMKAADMASSLAHTESLKKKLAASEAQLEKEKEVSQALARRLEILLEKNAALLTENKKIAADHSASPHRDGKPQRLQRTGSGKKRSPRVRSQKSFLSGMF